MENVNEKDVELNNGEEGGAEGETQKTFTAEEVEKLVQSEADRRTTLALKKQAAKYEKKLSLSQLDEEERNKAEKDLRIAELEEQLKEFNILQNKNEITKTLTARNLDARFADLIEIGDDIEEAQKKIDALDKMFKDAVAREVKARLATNGNSPKDTGKSAGELTKEEFSKMTIAQRSKLYAENPELYKALAE